MTGSSEDRPLWAPWRIKYILEDRESDNGCFICQHAEAPEEDEKRHVIARGDHCFVFLNLYPYNSGHLLISPYRHVASMCELSSEERCEMMDMLAKAEAVCNEAMRPDAFNIGCNLGHVAGAAVDDHIHFHFVPRWSGDTNFMPIIAGNDCVPQAIEETANMLRKHWAVQDA